MSNDIWFVTTYKADTGSYGRHVEGLGEAKRLILESARDMADKYDPPIIVVPVKEDGEVVRWVAKPYGSEDQDHLWPRAERVE